MANPATDELYTVIENMTASERVVGYLGPRGMRLGANEVVSLPGDLVSSLGALNQQGGRRRKFDAFERSLKAERVRINSRPAPVLFDDADERPKSLAVVSGVLGTVDPTYNSSQQSSFESVGF